MRLILNKVTSDNIADLFPSDWAPKPCFSEIQEKHFKVLSCKRMGLVQRYRLLFYQVYKFILSLAPQDVTAPELQEVSLYQFILI